MHAERSVGDGIYSRSPSQTYGVLYSFVRGSLVRSSPSRHAASQGVISAWVGTLRADIHALTQPRRRLGHELPVRLQQRVVPARACNDVAVSVHEM